MSLKKVEYVDNQTVITAEQMNAIQDAIIEAETSAFVKSVAHRGYSLEAPENTIPAYVLACKKGFKYAECDVRVTKDGIPVLLHDETIDRTSNGSGAVVDLTYAELLQYDFGSWKSAEYAGTKIPTFEEFIRCCRALGLHPYIELENHISITKEDVLNCVYIVKKYGMLENVTWVSFGWDKIDWINQILPNARVAWIGYDMELRANSDLNTTENDYFLLIDKNECDSESVQIAIDSGIPLEVWTINDVDEMLSLHPYISGVASDFLIAGDVLRGDALSGAVKNYFTISAELTDVTINNRSTVAVENSSYSATLTGDGALSVTVTMGGVDVTSSVYADGVINIASVTGNVVIVASVFDGWELVKTITPEQLHLGGLETDYNAEKGLFLTNATNRVSYPYYDIAVVGGVTYKLEYDAPSNVSAGMHFFNQKQMNVFNNKGGGSWSNILDSGKMYSGDEYTPTVEHNSSPIVGVRCTFLKSDNSDMTPNEITEVRVYKKVAE